MCPLRHMHGYGMKSNTCMSLHVVFLKGTTRHDNGHIGHIYF